MAQQQTPEHDTSPTAPVRAGGHLVEKGWTVYDAVGRPIGTVSEIDTSRNVLQVDGRPAGFGAYEAPLDLVGSSGGNEVRLTKVVDSPATQEGEVPTLVDPPAGTTTTTTGGRARSRAKAESAATATPFSKPASDQVTANVPSSGAGSTQTTREPVSNVKSFSPPYAATEPVTQSGTQTPNWGSDYISNGWSTKKMALGGLALGGLAAATYLMRRRMRKQTPYERFMDTASEYLGFASDFASDHLGTASDYFDAASDFARERHPAWWAGLAAAALPLAYYAWPSSKPTYQEQARDRADDLSSMFESYLKTLMARMPSGSERGRMASDAYRRMPSFSGLEMPSGWHMPGSWKRSNDWRTSSDWPVDPKIAVPAGVAAASALAFFVTKRMSGPRTSMRIGDVMTRQPRVIQPDATVADAAAMMRRLDIGSLPVCDGSRLVGMVTDRDITTRSTADGRDPHLTPVRDVMSPGVAWATEDDPVEEAARIMREHRIRRLPIVNDRHSLVGVVSLGDLATDLHDDAVSGNTLERVSEPNHHQ